MAVSVSAPSVNPASPLRPPEVAVLPASQPSQTAGMVRVSKVLGKLQGLLVSQKV